MGRFTKRPKRSCGLNRSDFRPLTAFLFLETLENFTSTHLHDRSEDGERKQGQRLSSRRHDSNPGEPETRSIGEQRNKFINGHSPEVTLHCIRQDD